MRYKLAGNEAQKDNCISEDIMRDRGDEISNFNNGIQTENDIYNI